MKPYAKTFTDLSTFGDFELQFEAAKNHIDALNNFKSSEYALVDHESSVKQSGKIGTIEKHSIHNEGELKGYLILFGTPDMKYLEVYTQPVEGA